MASPEGSQLKIGYVFDGQFDDSQGVPAYIETLGDYMESQGHEVHYIVGNSQQTADNVHAIGRTATFGINGNQVEVALPISGKRATEIIEEVHPDVLHVQMPHHPLVSGRILRNAEIPVVGSYHILPNSFGVRAGMSALASYSRLFEHIHPIISNSPATQSFVEKSYGVESPLIPCPIDLERFAGADRMPEFDDGKLNIGFMGRLVERKGVQHLVEALAGLKPDPEKVRLLIAGKGPLEEQLRQQVVDSGLSGMTEFLGFVLNHDKARFFASCDIAVFPATGGESFGIVLAEAMASGSGVVLGGSNPGYEGTLGKGAFELFDTNDTSILEAKLWRLMKDEGLRKEIHERQQKRVANFDIKVVGPQIAQIYSELTG